MNLMQLAQRNLITEVNQMVAGQYIEVLVLAGRLHVKQITLTGNPFQGESTGFWIFEESVYPWGVVNSEKSLLDRNVPANTYNQHTLWRSDEATLEYLSRLADTGRIGFGEYVTVLNQVHPDLCAVLVADKTRFASTGGYSFGEASGSARNVVKW